MDRSRPELLWVPPGGGLFTQSLDDASCFSAPYCVLGSARVGEAWMEGVPPSSVRWGR